MQSALWLRLHIKPFTDGKVRQSETKQKKWHKKSKLG